MQYNLPPGAELAEPRGKGNGKARADDNINKYIFLDLENLAFLAISLQPLQYRCRHFGINFRAYTNPEHEWADRATHRSNSTLKEAADVRMVIDATQLMVLENLNKQRCRILLITDDERFGKTLAAEEHDVERVAYDDPLPELWKTVFGYVDSVEEFFKNHDVVRERRGRSASQSSRHSESRGRSHERRSMSRDRSSRDPSGSRGDPSVSRVSWTRVGSETGRAAGSELGGESKKTNKSVNHLIDKVEELRKENEDLWMRITLERQSRELEAAAARQQSGGRGGGKGGGGRGGGGKGGGGKGGGGKGGGKGGALPPSPAPQDKAGRPRQWPAGQEPTAGKHIGRIIRFFGEKAYGFINIHGVGDVFVHKNDISIVDAVPPDERLRHWDVELRLENDRHKAGRRKCVAVTGPQGRPLPLPRNERTN